MPSFNSFGAAFAAASHLACSVLTDLHVSCSHMGDLTKDIRCIDSADSDRCCFRGIDLQTSVRMLEQRQGVATLLDGVMPGVQLPNFVIYRLGIVTQMEELRAMAEGRLVDYGLTGTCLDD